MATAASKNHFRRECDGGRGVDGGGAAGELEVIAACRSACATASAGAAGEPSWDAGGTSFGVAAVVSADVTGGCSFVLAMSHPALGWRQTWLIIGEIAVETLH
jgi:hypothetical protein